MRSRQKFHEFVISEGVRSGICSIDVGTGEWRKMDSTIV